MEQAGSPRQFLSESVDLAREHFDPLRDSVSAPVEYLSQLR